MVAPVVNTSSTSRIRWLLQALAVNESPALMARSALESRPWLREPCERKSTCRLVAGAALRTPDVVGDAGPPEGAGSDGAEAAAAVWRRAVSAAARACA